MQHANPFSPSFSAVPTMFFGRSQYLSAAEQGLNNPRSAYRAMFLLGTRGCGKTVLLHHIAEMARDERWVAHEIHSSHAAARLRSLLEGDAQTPNMRISLSPHVRTPDGTSLSIGEATIDHSDAERPEFLAQLLINVCKGPKKHRGVLIAIDEAQKLDEDDAVQICDAIQTAKSQGCEAMLVLAGLPKSKERIGSFGGCTFMKRAKEFVLKPLNRTETAEAFSSLFARVPEIAISGKQLAELAHFSQGHPYLIQLLGHELYEQVDRQYGNMLGKTIPNIEITPEELLHAQDNAYWVYRQDVLEPTLEELGDNAMQYIRALASTMGEKGIMESGLPAARAMGASAGDAAYYRDKLIRLCIIQNAGRGKAKFLLPYIPRALEERDLEIVINDVDDDDWDMEV